ncbi:hypothetical protein [Kitasatospora sp. NPDC056181]|uniref:hypothetical protein n=1 Tax=Kitasatospora sp. NPDC056181 TaxID=3345737 RepID=UPI0035D8AACA
MVTTKKTTAPCRAHAADSWGNCPVAELRTVQTRLLALLERYADGPLSISYRFSPDETAQRAIRLLAALLKCLPEPYGVTPGAPAGPSAAGCARR